MKTITLLILIAFCTNCFALNLQMNPSLFSAVQQSLYSEISELDFIKKIDSIIQSNELTEFDYDYLGDAVITIKEKNLNFDSAFAKYKCFAPENKFEHLCESQNKDLVKNLKKTQQLQDAKANLESGKINIENSNSSISEIEQNNSKKLYYGIGATVVAIMLFDFFSKNELVLETNF